MSALPWIIGGAALGVGVLIIRSRAAKVETQPPQACDAIAKATGISVGACNDILGIAKQAAGAIGDAIGAKTSADVERWDTENRALNGAVRIPNDGFRKALAQSSTSHGMVAALDGSVVEFENGCVPMRGAPGWEKCVPGTHPMLNYPPNRLLYFNPDEQRTDDFGPSAVAPMTGAVRKHGESNGSFDPFTTGGFDPAKTPPQNFPIPIPSGHVGYWYRGRPFTCPKGSPPQFAHSAIAGASYDPNFIPPCAQQRENVAAGNQGYTDYQLGLDNPIDYGIVQHDYAGECSQNPEYLWDPAGFCRRRRVGE